MAGAFLRSHHPHRRIEAALTMTPMIDVVFLLIIFFMCSQFHTHEGELLARLPARSGIVPGARVADLPLTTVRIFVSRTDDGPQYLLNGAPLADRDRLFPALAALRQRRPELAEAILDGDDQLDFEHFLFAFNACLRAGITRVNLVRPNVAAPED